MMTTPSQIMTAIHTELRRRQWTQEQLADHIGVSPPTLSRWLSGRRQPALPDVERLLAALSLVVRRGRPPRR